MIHTHNAPIAQIIPFQPGLCPALPRIEGNVDYKNHDALLNRIGQILIDSGAQQKFVQLSVDQYEANATAQNQPLTDAQRARHHAHSIRALRTMILRPILSLSFRDLSRHLAESALARNFCEIEQDLECVQVPSKSTLQEYAHFVPDEQTRTIVDHILLAASAAEGTPNSLAGNTLYTPIDLDIIWADATCLCPNIHVPVDWLLLRDAIRTLMKATLCIRRVGLLHRMEPPETFLRRINALCIRMAQARRKADAKSLRKSILRQIKKLVNIVRKHAQAHLALLEKDYASVGLSQAQMEQIKGRINNILKQLPAAMEQAHERIIGERAVASDKKILSLYEPATHVIVRGKAGAEVEFGNTLYLGEQRNGLIVDWSLEEKSVTREGKLIEESLERLDEIVGVGAEGAIKEIVYDRGGGTSKVAAYLEKKGVKNSTCPRSPVAMEEQLKDPHFAAVQRRRGGTEARIGIFKNVMMEAPVRAKGIKHRQQAVTWAVLAHNLWVLARLPSAAEGAAAAAAKKGGKTPMGAQQKQAA